jgi:hypothetical protein
MIGFISKYMLECQLESLLSPRHPVLLDWNSNTPPIGLLFAFEDRQMPLFKQLDLITHVDYAEGDGCSLGDSFHRKIKPSLVGRERVSIY